MRVSRSVLFAFERHYARLERDAQRMHVPFPWSASELEAALLSLVEANDAYDAVLRVAVVRNRGGLFEGPDLPECDLVAFTAELARWGAAANLSYVPHGRYGASPFAGTKITSWAQNLTWYEEARAAGFDEVVLLNEHGQVSECTSANIFCIQGRQVWTPPLGSSGCLPGVTRAILLEELQTGDISVSERELYPSDLERSDGVFITSTTRDLLPVRSINGLELPQDGKVLAVMQRWFHAYQSSYVANALPHRNLVNS